MTAHYSYFRRILIMVMTTIQFLILLIAVRTLNFSRVKSLVESTFSFIRLQDPTEIHLSFAVARKLTVLLSIQNPCYIVSLLLYWIAKPYGKLHIGRDPASHQVHCWITVKSEIYSTDIEFQGSENCPTIILNHSQKDLNP